MSLWSTSVLLLRPAGDLDHQSETVAEIQPGKVVFEIVGVPEELAREAFRLAAAKLPLRTTFVSRMIGA